MVTRSLVLLFRQCPWWSGGVAIDLAYRPRCISARPWPGNVRRCALNRIGNLRQSPVHLCYAITITNGQGAVWATKNATPAKREYTVVHDGQRQHARCFTWPWHSIGLD